MSIVYLIIGIILLLKGGDVLVDGSVSVSRRLNISDIVIGLTVVAFGTSMPELTVNLIASIQGSAEIAIGNVIGSNIANILLILGVAALIAPLPVNRNTVLSEIPFSLMAAILMGFLANAALLSDDRVHLEISRIDGSILLFFFLLFMAYIFIIARENNDICDELPEGAQTIKKSIILIVAGIFMLYLGGKFTVKGAVEIATILGMSKVFIGLTIVAVGTSLPELVTSAMAAKKGNTDIAVGNVVGSNIFNIFWVLGLSSVINPIRFELSSNPDIVMLIFSSCLLLGALLVGKRNTIDQGNGILFLITYIGYLIYLVKRG